MGTTANTTLSAKISRLRRRPDFQRNPVAAVRRRLWWRLRWAISSQPWQLKLGDDIEIVAPKGGAGALIYYQRYSEPETARFLTAFLKPGMVFWDIGANIGEYSLLAARCVGPAGVVEAFEPQPAVYAYLQRNIEANHATNIRPHQRAVCDAVGSAELSLLSDPSLAFLTPHNRGREASSSVPVSTISLDHFHRSVGLTPALIKVDVEGAEQLVLKGSRNLIGLERDAPTWIIEYEPENCERFRYRACDLISHFAQRGYATYWLADQNYLVPIAPGESKEMAGNFVASKRLPLSWPNA
jgi:FkbM family methyltransferase